MKQHCSIKNIWLKRNNRFHGKQAADKPPPSRAADKPPPRSHQGWVDLEMRNVITWKTKCHHIEGQQPASHAANQPISQPARLPASQLASQPARQAASQKAKQPASQPVNQQANQQEKMDENGGESYGVGGGALLSVITTLIYLPEKIFFLFLHSISEPVCF